MWTAAAFSRDINFENILVLGSNMGFIEFADVKEVYDPDRFIITERRKQFGDISDVILSLFSSFSNNWPYDK